MTAPYYDDGGGRVIYHADCREVLPTLTGIDAVITDPPYNFGKDYGDHDDAMTADDYERWCAEWFGLCETAAQRVVVFPGHGNIGMWFRIRKPTAVGCWYKPGNHASSIIGFAEWEPWFYWAQRCNPTLGGSSVIRALNYNRLRHDGDHPNVKPVPLMGALIRKTRATMVCDPFLGSGTTLVASKLEGVPGVGIELEERYCEVAAQRLSQGVLPL